MRHSPRFLGAKGGHFGWMWNNSNFSLAGRKYHYCYRRLIEKVTFSASPGKKIVSATRAPNSTTFYLPNCVIYYFLQLLREASLNARNARFSIHIFMQEKGIFDACVGKNIFYKLETIKIVYNNNKTMKIKKIITIINIFSASPYVPPHHTIKKKQLPSHWHMPSSNLIY